VKKNRREQRLRDLWEKKREREKDDNKLSLRKLEITRSTAFNKRTITSVTTIEPTIIKRALNISLKLQKQAWNKHQRNSTKDFNGEQEAWYRREGYHLLLQIILRWWYFLGTILKLLCHTPASSIEAANASGSMQFGFYSSWMIFSMIWPKCKTTFLRLMYIVTCSLLIEASLILSKQTRIKQ